VSTRSDQDVKQSPRRCSTQCTLPCHPPFNQTTPRISPSSFDHKSSHGELGNPCYIACLIQVETYPTYRHPSSTLTHEAAVAVLYLSPDKFWPFSKALFDKQVEFFDVNVVNETRNQTYRRLAEIAAGVGIDRDQILKLLTIPEKPKGDSYNVGNA